MSARVVKLTRDPSTPEGTFGTLVFSGQLLRTVELPWRNNATGRSCIPPGRYRCEIVNSPRFGRVYGLRDVPGRSNILIHAGNFGGDVDAGWSSDLLGCISPVMSIGSLRNKQGKAQAAGLRSKEALGVLMAWAGGLPFDLVIE